MKPNRAFFATILVAAASCSSPESGADVDADNERRFTATSPRGDAGGRSGEGDVDDALAEFLADGSRTALVVAKYGFAVGDAPPKEGRPFRVVVVAVLSGSAADLAGLRAGQVFLSVGSRTVVAAKDCVDAFSREPEPIVVAVMNAAEESNSGVPVAKVLAIGAGPAPWEESPENADRAEFKGIFDDVLRRVIAEEGGVVGGTGRPESRPGRPLLEGPLDTPAPASRPTDK